MSASPASRHATVVPLRPGDPPPVPQSVRVEPARRAPLWRNVIGDVLRQERLAQQRTLKDVGASAGISMPYLSEIERGLKEASSEMLAAAAGALGLDLVDLLARAYGDLVRERAPQRPLRLTTGDELSAPRPTLTDDRSAATDLTSRVEASSTIGVTSRHTGQVLLFAA